MSRPPTTDPPRPLGLVYFGPVALLLIAVVTVLVIGPSAAYRIEYASRHAETEQRRHDLAEGGQVLTSLSESFGEVARAVEQSVVHITVYRRATGDRGGSEVATPRPRPDGSGSGWVYAHEGEDGRTRHFILTNYHVVSGAERIIVRFKDRQEQEATLHGTDPKTDVAVLEVNERMIPAVIASRQARQGDIVFAFGSPFHFDFSMSQGVVSATGRHPGVLPEGSYEKFIQTDAAINPGNSGGPLTNVRGEVVGMNTAIATRDGSFSGIGFAISVDRVRHVADQIIEHGRVARGFLAVTIRDVDPDEAVAFDFDQRGVLVMDVLEGGAADRAGLEPDDIITHVNETRVHDAQDLRNLIADFLPGTAVTLELARRGESRQLEAELDELPDDPAEALRRLEPQAEAEPEAGHELLRRIGLDRIGQVSPREALRRGLARHDGLLVYERQPDSPAADAGLDPGMLIVAIEGERVRTLADLVERLDAAGSGRRIRVTVHTAGRERDLLLRMP